MQVCEELGVTPDLTELAFGCEDDLLAWMERHARGRRNQGKTERDYYIGGRHMREKGPVGRPRKNLHGVQNKDEVAEAIAKQEGCSVRHVYKCAKMAETINQLNVEALRPIKWAILSEQCKYGKAWRVSAWALSRGRRRGTVTRMKAGRQVLATPYRP